MIVGTPVLAEVFVGELPDGFVDIDDYIAEIEQSPERKALLDAARVRLYRTELTRLRLIEQAARAVCSPEGFSTKEFEALRSSLGEKVDG
jgi:hypothetical protein